MIILSLIHDPTSSLDLIDLMQEIFKTAENILYVLTSTTDTIDSIKFEDQQFINQYLGYAKNVMGSPLYTLFTSMVLASIGLSIFTYFLKGLRYIKALLPW